MIASTTRRWVTGFAAVAALVASASVLAGEPLKLAYVEFFPYTYTEDGQPKGVLMEAMTAAAAKAGLSFTAESLPAKRLFQGIAEGDYDIFPGVKAAAVFKDTTITSGRPIATIELHAWSIGEPPLISAKEDLAGKKIITLSGYTYGGWRAYMDDPANKVEKIEALSPEQALTLLKAGRANLLLQYRLPMQQALGGETVPGLRSTKLQSTDLYIVVSNKTRDAAEVLRRLEEAYPWPDTRSGETSGPPNS